MPAQTRAAQHHDEHVAHRRVAAEQRHRIGADRIEQRLPERHQAGAPQDDEAEHDQRIGEGDGGERDQPRRQQRRDRRDRDEGERSEQGCARMPCQIFRGAGLA